MTIGKNILAMKFLKMMSTPFEETDAFKFGIIDNSGNVVKKPLTTEESNSYSLLERLVFTLKRLIEKVPGGRNKIGSIAAAYWLVKESNEETDLNDLEKRFTKLVEMDVCFIEEECEIESIVEDGEGIAANNTSGVEVKNPDAVPKRKKTVKDFIRRKDMSVQLEK